MDAELAQSWAFLLERQRGVVSRAQAQQHGLSDDCVRGRVHSGRWRLLHRGVYATFSGEPGREAELWAAVLRAGEGALLSHGTAAELLQLADGPEPVIHVTVPGSRHPEGIDGVRVHLSRRAATVAHPAGLPPRTRLEETVLDLADSSAHLDDACAWVFRAVGRRLTTVPRLRAALGERSRARWRTGLTAALADEGMHSLLEYRYARDAERAHGLPPAIRQARVVLGAASAHLDNFYEAAMLAVELDGAAAHGLDRRWADMRRDNLNAVQGILTLRYTWADVTGRPCEVAGQVAEVLSRRGMRVTPRRCGPGCRVAARRAS